MNSGRRSNLLGHEKIASSLKNTPRNDTNLAQVTLEFTFSMILVLLLMYGVIRVMGWVALTLAERRVAHENSLTKQTSVESWKNIYKDPSPLLQLEPEFYTTNKMKLVFNSW